MVVVAIALLGYHSHAIRFTRLKCEVQSFPVHSRSWTTIPTVIPRTFSSARTPRHLPHALQPWATRIHFLSLWICFFWTFHINGTSQHVAFVSGFFDLREFFKALPCCRRYVSFLPQLNDILCERAQCASHPSGDGHAVSPPLGCCEECYGPHFLSSAFSPRNGVWLRRGKHVCLTYNQLRGGAVGDPSPVSPGRSCREHPSSQRSTPRLVSLGNHPFLPSWCMDRGHAGLCIRPNPGHTRSSQGANPEPYLAGPEGPQVSAPSPPHHQLPAQGPAGWSF